MRKIEYILCYINIADIEVVLFSSEFLNQVEYMASTWEGPESRLYIKKVWHL